jgi:hypothetical protein
MEATMNLASKSRTRLFRELDKVLGRPENMTDKKKRIVRELLGRWYYQKNYNGKKESGHYRYAETLTRKTGDYKPHVQKKYFYDAAIKSLACFPKSLGRTSIQSLIKHPDVAPADAVLIPKPAGEILSAPRVGWDYLSRYGSMMTIVIPANYYATVKRHGVQMDGRKIVQRIWNHRVYEDKETWECMYWHITSKVPTHHSGYVCKTGTHISVHPTLEMALGMARKKTVAAAIKSIMKDETS